MLEYLAFQRRTCIRVKDRVYVFPIRDETFSFFPLPYIDSLYLRMNKYTVKELDGFLGCYGGHYEAREKKDSKKRRLQWLLHEKCGYTMEEAAGLVKVAGPVSMSCF